MSQDLKFRVERFSKFPRPDVKISDLIYKYELKEDPDFADLRLAVMLFMCKSVEMPYSIGWNSLVEFETRILEYYSENRNQLKHVTPNGLMVPKRHSSLEFNMISQIFYKLMEKKGFHSLIRSWNVPLNIRIKFGALSKEHLQRRFASEHVHSDAWVGENKECGTAMLLIAGDARNNSVKFYHPDDNFSNQWLDSQDSYEEAYKKIINNYKKMNSETEVGNLLVSDFATLHNSFVESGAKSRVSIDTTFSYIEDAERWRGERANLETIRQIGKKYYFLFPHLIDQKVDSQKSKKQAVCSKLVDMLGENQ